MLDLLLENKLNCRTKMIKADFPLFLDVITKFYDKATFDVMIGYHFRGIKDFNSHLPRIASFWQLQLTGKMEHKTELPFDLINVHIPLKIKKAEINRWVILFEQNLKEFKLDDEFYELWMEKVNLFKEKLKGGLCL